MIKIEDVIITHIDNAINNWHKSWKEYIAFLKYKNKEE